MTRQHIAEQIRKKGSFLCVGLDTDITKIPTHLHQLENPVFEFNRQIIDATHDLAVSYKLNTAFYEAVGLQGWKNLEKTISYIKENYPEIFVIADAKRGDIGNTSKMYAKAIFEHLQADAITVAPYMGEDSVKPFLDYENKWTIVLGLTSNKGSKDFQQKTIEQTKIKLYEEVLNISQTWGSVDNMMYVIGATKAEYLKEIRTIVPGHFFLVPGVGAQGGSLSEVAENGMNDDIGLLVNSSRGIIYSDDTEKFSSSARIEAKKIAEAMKAYL